MPPPRLRTSPVTPLALLLACSIAVALPSRAAELKLEWCTGLSPISWGFAVTPPSACTEFRLKSSSASVAILSAKGGPSLPAGWTVSLSADARCVVATGPTPLEAGTELSNCLVLETDRCASNISQRGVTPVKWELTCGGTPSLHSFTPVLDLADATSRGIVLSTARALTCSGPVEVTVDNPTLEPLLLDLPPGTLLRAGEQDWVIGLVKPFEMMRKQKTGRTLAAFPVTWSEGATQPPRKLALTSRKHEKSEALAEIALAVQALQAERGKSKAQAGEFEYWEPFDFWPIALQWSFWNETGSPPRMVLLNLVQNVLQTRSAGGDKRAASIDPVAASQEVENVLSLLAAARVKVRAASLPVPLQASRARFCQ